MYRKYDAGDEYVRELWRVTREWALEELRDVPRTDVKMDVWFYDRTWTSHRKPSSKRVDPERHRRR
ncbi:MAG: hypothetical protein U0V48_08610 [Anaerolineales bacterium]